MIRQGTGTGAWNLQKATLFVCYVMMMYITKTSLQNSYHYRANIQDVMLSDVV